MSNRFYEEEEAHEILRRAAGNVPGSSSSSGISRDNLLRTAAELGISPEDLEAAERQVRIDRNRATLFAEFTRERRRAFSTSLATYLIVNAFLLAVDLLTGGGLWFYWPLLGWGIGMATEAFRTFGPDSKIDGPAFKRWVTKRRKRERRDQEEANRARGLDYSERRRKRSDDDDDDDDDD